MPKFRKHPLRGEDNRRGYSPSRAKFRASKAMIADEFFPISGFDSCDLVICQRSEFPFSPAARKRTGILPEEPEEQIRQAIRHIDDLGYVVPKRIVPTLKFRFFRNVQFDSSLHAAVQELSLRRCIEKSIKVAGIVQHPNVAVFRRFPPNQRQHALRIIFERGAVVFDPVQNRRRHRKHESWRIEAVPGQNVVSQITVQPAVPVVKRMDIDKAEGENRCGDYRIELPSGYSVESGQSLYKLHQIIRSSADMVGDWCARLAVVLTDKAAFGPQTQTNKSVVSDHDALQMKEFVAIDRLPPGLADSAGPSLDAILGRMLALNCETRL